ncbi:MAG: TetR/AcrR family transcriptional regulator [Clostridia bacterium]|nr:TetR/AcrR family transcriptional regulator [Clostridia bacterium]
MELKKEDRRVRKTKRLLRQGLSQLILEKSIKDITVRELTELVDINRGTFYIHYRDIYDMVAQLEDEILNELSTILTSHTAREGTDIIQEARALLVELYTYVADNRDLCMALLGQNGDIAFLRSLEKMVHDGCLKALLDSFPQAHVQQLEYLYEFASAGSAATMRTWLSEGMKESPEDMAALTQQLISGIIRGVLM